MIYTMGVVFLCMIALRTGVNKRVLLMLTFVFLACVAILFEPQAGLDLYEHYETLRAMRWFGYGKTIEQNAHAMGNLPVYSAFYYLVSLLKFDKLLLVITYFVVYGCMFRVLSMYVEDNGLSLNNWKLGYVMIMLVANAYSITGIRYSLAFSVVFLFLYIDLVRKEHRVISLIAYLLMCMLHDGMILLIMIRFLLYIPSTKVISKLEYLVLFWKLLLDIVNQVLIAIPHPFFSEVAAKLMLYSAPESASMWVGGIGMRMLGIVRGVILFALFMYCFLREDRHKNESYIRMLRLLILFCFGGISSAALTDRYTNVTLLYAVPFMLSINNDSDLDEESNRVLIRVKMLPLLGLVIGYFACLVVFQYRYFI